MPILDQYVYLDEVKNHLACSWYWIRHSITQGPSSSTTMLLSPMTWPAINNQDPSITCPYSHLDFLHLPFSMFSIEWLENTRPKSAPKNTQLHPITCKNCLNLMDHQYEDSIITKSFFFSFKMGSYKVHYLALNVFIAIKWDSYFGLLYLVIYTKDWKRRHINPNIKLIKCCFIDIQMYLSWISTYIHPLFSCFHSWLHGLLGCATGNKNMIS